jgi:hypothetical protein
LKKGVSDHTKALASGQSFVVKSQQISIQVTHRTMDTWDLSLDGYGSPEKVT